MVDQRTSLRISSSHDSILLVQVDHYNHGQGASRPMMFVTHQPQQIVQSPSQPSFFFAGQAPHFQQPYSGHLPLQQQQQHHQQQQQQPSLIFLPIQQQQPHLQQSWIPQSSPQPPPPLSQPFVPQPTNTNNFHPIQPHVFPPQPSFSGGSGIAQNNFNRTGHAPLPSLGSGTGIPQPAFSGGTAVLKRKSHYLEESNFDPSVRMLRLDVDLEASLVIVSNGSLHSSRIAIMKATENFHLREACRANHSRTGSSSVFDRHNHGLPIVLECTGKCLHRQDPIKTRLANHSIAHRRILPGRTILFTRNRVLLRCRPPPVTRRNRSSNGYSRISSFKSISRCRYAPHARL